MDYYNREEVFKETLKYFKGDTLSTDVWINKYALKDHSGKIYEKTPNDMHKRISKELYKIEKKYPNGLDEETIFNLIKDFKYIIPQGSPMAGIGNENQVVSLSNCFVIGNEADSYGGIFLTDQEQAQLMKRRGGVGHDLSHIRPKSSPVKNSALTSTGVVPFMERYSNTTREVAQDGRRGALMLTISINHPDSEDFIDAKIDTSKITGANVSVRIDDKFMKSIEENKEYKQTFPVESLKPKYEKIIKPKKLWNKIVQNAWKSAEPGILFWDTIINESVADSYADLGFKTVSTNPCIVGDTLVAVADGRNYVKIKDLANENKDVPVYTLDNNDNICIRTMRNPRLTGKNKKIFKLTLDNGHTIRVTDNHKFKLKSGEYIETKDLKNGDSLFILTETDMSFNDLNIKSNSISQDYKWLSVSGKKGLKSQHRMISEHFYNKKILPGEVVHHVDYNGKNNNPENLIIMTKKEHDILHSKDMIGDKNPYHKMNIEWKQNFASHPGKNNGRYINIDNFEIIEYAKKLTQKLNRRFSVKEWVKYAKENNLPTTFSNYRNSLDGVISLSKKVSLELGIEYINEDPRLVKTYIKALDNGYNARIYNNNVLIKKICEECGNEYEINYHKREISFCSHECSLKYINKNNKIIEKRKNSINNTYKNKSGINKEKQIETLSNLNFKLGRIPLLREWENDCKLNNIPHRLGTKYGYKDYKEIVEELEYYNHKVVSVEEDGYEDVYNGTVDEFHNFFSGGFKEKNKFGKDKFVSINNLQCGEITLCPYDSCRLTAINLFSYVDNPFTKDSKFNWEKFKKHVRYAQRFMDDIVDLEIEKIDMILSKIKSDPEDEYIKSIEIDLWEKIKDKAIRGRRTGLGVTAEGDMLASLGLIYGTEKATDFSIELHKTLAIESYKSSAIMAKERGSFPIYDYEKENNSKFIQRIRKSDAELDNMMKEWGRRNISLLTIAPTGSASIMSQTSSGIEPTFLTAYKRRRKINPNDKNSTSHFVDNNEDHWEEYTVIHHHFGTWLKMNGYDIEEFKKLKQKEIDEIIKKSPYYKATSNDVDWFEKVKMQGGVQKWVDHSISVTINLPENTTEKTVDELYRTAWKYGCKGVTVYRDGSRSGVLIKNDDSSNKKISEVLKENNAAKRPKTLECEVVNFVNNKEKWIGFLGMYEDENGDKYPYEMFTGLLESFTVPSYVDYGWIKKYKNEDGKSRYDFIYKDKDGYDIIMSGLNRAFNRELWNTSKMISALLRHRIHLPTILNLVDSLKINGSVDGIMFGTWQSGVKRILKKYLKSNQIENSDISICPSCGSDSLNMSEGCMTCSQCGWSKC